MKNKTTKRLLAILLLVMMVAGVPAFSNFCEYVNADTIGEESVPAKTIVSAKAKNAAVLKETAQEFEVVTSKDVQNLMLYAEGGSPLVKSWAASGNSTVSGNVRTWTVSHAINSAGNRKLVFKGGTTNTTPVTNAVTVSFKVENTGVISASAKSAAIKKGGEQVFTVQTTADAKYLMEYAEGGNLVKTWSASSSSTVSGNVRTWTVSQNIASAGKRKLTFKAGTTSTPTAVQRSVEFTVEDVWVNSASAKYATIGKGGTQTFTAKTTSNAKYLMLYAEGGNLVKTWTASSSNSTVSGDVRTWTVSLSIGSAGNRELKIKAGKTTTPSAFAATVKFAVVEKKLISASAKYATITKGTPQTFEVVTSADVKTLMLYAEDGYFVKSWAASGNSTETAEKTRKWTVSLSIGTTGKRKLTFKGGISNTTPVTNVLTVSFTVEDANASVISASVQYDTIIKGTSQTFIVKTSSNANYLMMYGEGGNLVKTWTASSDNSMVSGSVRTWTVIYTIGTAGKRKLTFKAGTTSTPTASQASVECMVLASVSVNASNFPDDNFRNYVTKNIDINKDNALSADELKAVEALNVYSLKIQSLKGIEYFTELKGLMCYSNPIESLDLSGNRKLESLDCSGIFAKTLDLKNNTELTFLECGFNSLEELDLSNNKKLKVLYCAAIDLPALNLTANTELEKVYCYSNKITSLDLSKCTKLTVLNCHDNKLDALNVSANTALETLKCSYNSITALDVSQNKELTSLIVDSGVTVTGAENVTIEWK